MPRSRPPRPPSGAARDGQRARVYAAEDAWALLLDAARQGAGRAQVAGSAVVLPAEVRFGDLSAAQAYADHQLRAWAVPPVVLRQRRGMAKAHWESPATIALPIPAHGTPWALREAVLLHELAHHLAFHLDTQAEAGTGHGPAFVARMLELVEHALGPEAALALRVDYGEQQVV
jgi:putative metallohydrolase (TIGR04338 family)